MGTVVHKEFIQFLSEFQEKLEAVINSLYNLEKGEEVDVEEIQRFIHTIKGAGAIIGLEKTSRCFHCVESLLKQVFKGHTDSIVLLGLALQGLEACAEAMSTAEDGEGVEKEITPQVDNLEVFADDDDDDDYQPAASPPPVPASGSAPPSLPDAGTLPAIEIAPFVYADTDEELLAAFLEEAQEMVDATVDGLLEIEKNGSPEEVNNVFRAIHTLKGSGGMAGVDRLSKLAHKMETILDRVRKGDLAASGTLIDAFLQGTDVLKTIVNRLQKREEIDDVDIIGQFIQLDAVAGGGPIAAAPPAVPVAAPPPVPVAVPSIPDIPVAPVIPAAAVDVPEIEITPFRYEDTDRELLAAFLEEAQEMLDNTVDGLLEIEKNGSPDEINNVFRAIHTLKGSGGMAGVDRLSKLAHKMETILDRVRKGDVPITGLLTDVFLQGTDVLKKIVTRLQAGEGIDDIEIASHFVQLEAAATGQTVEPVTSSPPAASTTPPAVPVAPPPLAAAPQAPAPVVAAEKNETAASLQVAKKKVSQQKFLRVDVEKLDDAINQMGELVIERIRLEQETGNIYLAKEHFRNVRDDILDDLARTITYDELKDILLKMVDQFDQNVESLHSAVEHFKLIASNLQESVMKMRLIPIGQVFNRFPRLVRDISREIKKEMIFDMTGMETEIDKSVCEQLVDPMIHLIRNSIDHGIEQPEVREAAGKSPTGTIQVDAYYKGDNVIIDIIDDGKGMDSDKIVASAIGKGLLTADAAELLEEKEKLMLIFRPGFSTKAEVSELSGRGVGMDVVQNTVEKLKGLVDVKTERGQGTTITMSLPLSLAIVNVLIFKLENSRGDKETFCIPLYSVLETIKCSEEAIRVVSGRRVVELRGEVIPIIHCQDVFGIPLRPPPPGKEKDEHPVILIGMADSKVGIIVDELHGKQEVVQKSLGTMLNRVPYLTGATIMGDGTVVSIIDPGEVIRNLSTFTEQTRSKLKKERPILLSDVILEPKSVLVVEDSQTVSAIIKNLLEGIGCRVDTAPDGEAAYRLLQRNMYDLFSVDLNMPGMDGFTLCAKIRELEAYATTPLVILTSRTSKEDKIRGFEIGVDEYITKPIDRELYTRVISKLLQ